jgi:membrane protein implicated in regulation of membrane protease activity
VAQAAFPGGGEPLDHAVVGRPGTVTHPIAGGSNPGEVRVDVRGTTELFIAYADTALPVGAAVLVYRSRGHRDVDVMPDPSAP